MNYGIFGSSEDPTKIGDTVKGVLFGIAPLVVLIARHYDVELTENQIAELAGVLGAIFAGLWTLYGLLKKLFVKTYGNL